jgi:methylmalonyl-CoA mutase
LCTDIQFKRDFEGDIARLNATAKLNFDLIAQEIEDGSWFSTKEIFIDYFKKTKSFSNLWISGNVYGDAGATTIQELAFTLTHLNEYVDMLVNSGESLATMNKNLNIELSVTENYFVNIAKMRVIRTLVRGLFEAYDAKHTHLPITLYAKTAQRHLAINDSNSNLLRQTTQAMSAVLGGCDVLTVQTLKTGDAVQDAIHERMAKNIQLVLKEEAYLDKVVDPSAGSYYLESLSNQLLISAWDKFKEIERLGGFGDCIQNNFIQNQIEENKAYLIEQLNTKKATFLGVNKHPSALETWKNLEPAEIPKTKTFKAIVPFRLESHYTQNVTA